MNEAALAPAWIDPDKAAGSKIAPAWVDPDKAAESKAAARQDYKPFGADGFTFWDLLDVINPLQHIPIISSIYRKLTGDEISPVARIAGATLFGGPIGAAVAMADTVFEHKTGRDIGATAMAALFPEDPDTGATQVALGPPPLAQGFAPRVGDPIQLVPAAFVPAATPDLQALASFATAAGSAPAIGEPIKLEPRQVEAKEAIQDWQPAPAHEEDRTASARRAIPPASDLPKGAAATLNRRAMRAYAAGNPAAATLSNMPPPTAAIKALERDTAEAQDDWIIASMMKALDKYQASHRLQSTAPEPAQAVWR